MLVEPAELVIIEIEDQDSCPPFPFLGLTANGQLACWLGISERLCYPSGLPFRVFGVWVPGNNRRRQFLDPLPVGDFGQQLVAACQQVVDIGIIAATPINAQDGSLAETRIEIQNGFGRRNQLWQAAIELCFTGVKPFADDFVIQGSIHPAQLSASLVLLLGKIPFFRPLTLTSGGHPAHVNIQQLATTPIIMSIAGPVTLIDGLHSLAHLLNIFCLTGIQGGTDARLVSTALPTKGCR